MARDRDQATLCCIGAVSGNSRNAAQRNRRRARHEPLSPGSPWDAGWIAPSRSGSERGDRAGLGVAAISGALSIAQIVISAPYRPYRRVDAARVDAERRVVGHLPASVPCGVEVELEPNTVGSLVCETPISTGCHEGRRQAMKRLEWGPPRAGRRSCRSNRKRSSGSRSARVPAVFVKADRLVLTIEVVVGTDRAARSRAG